jgi:PAS domain S-box-containing protein
MGVDVKDDHRGGGQSGHGNPDARGRRVRTPGRRRRGKTEEALRLAEERYRNIFEHAVEGIFQTTPEGRYLTANPMLARIYGYDSPADLIAAFTDIKSQLYVEPGRRDEFMNELLEHDAVWGFESQIFRRDGSVIWISENARAVRDTEGALIGFEGTVVDITARKRAEAELARVRQRESLIGARIQQTLLLGKPPRDLPGVQVAALTIASRQIDGDFYDFLAHDTHCLDVVVGDVMGKGIPAALLGAAIKSRILHALSHLLFVSGRGDLPEPEEIVARVHADVTEQFIDLRFFATLCYMRFDMRRHRVSFVDCGHTKTLHLKHRTGLCALLEGDNVPLGCSETEVYRQVCVPFEPGDLFVFYSDGVTEAQSPNGETFDIDRLVELLQAHADLDPEALVARVRQAVVDFSRSETFADDLTCVVVRTRVTDGDRS